MRLKNNNYITIKYKLYFIDGIWVVIRFQRESIMNCVALPIGWSYQIKEISRVKYNAILVTENIHYHSIFRMLNARVKNEMSN